MCHVSQKYIPDIKFWFSLHMFFIILVKTFNFYLQYSGDNMSVSRALKRLRKGLIFTVPIMCFFPHCTRQGLWTMSFPTDSAAQQSPQMFTLMSKKYCHLHIPTWISVSSSSWVTQTCSRRKSAFSSAMVFFCLLSKGCSRARKTSPPATR